MRGRRSVSGMARRGGIMVGLAVVLAGCGAGQITQTDTQSSGVNGANNSIPANIVTTINSSVTNPYCRVVTPYLTSLRGLATRCVRATGRCAPQWTARRV